MDNNSQHIVLKTQNLSIGYTSKKKQTVIGNNINIELHKGELIGLIGANGIGKSTLLRTLTKVQNPLSGDIFINNKEASSYAAIDLAKALSLVLTESLVSKNLSSQEIATGLVL